MRGGRSSRASHRLTLLLLAPDLGNAARTDIYGVCSGDRMEPSPKRDVEPWVREDGWLCFRSWSDSGEREAAVCDPPATTRLEGRAPLEIP